jgi:hypothetical protein
MEVTRCKSIRRAKEDEKPVVVSRDIEWMHSLWVKRPGRLLSLQWGQKMTNKFGEVHVHREAATAKEYWQVERVLNNRGFECLMEGFAANENIGAALKVSRLPRWQD